MSPPSGVAPPGDYEVVVIGSGAGAMQTSYFLGRRGIRHAVISKDEEPGGMFRRYPYFQRLITWTKPYAPVARDASIYEWYDWNSLLAEEESSRHLVVDGMDGSSYFPTRAEMEAGLVGFARHNQLPIRFECRWETTERTAEGFKVNTSDGQYTCKIVVVAVGMTEAWKPSNITGIEDVPHYVDVRPAKEYRGRTVFIIGKRNSGFEIADALLPHASRIILGSPRPARISVLVHSTAAARARYLQPYEDHILAGGTVILDAAIQRVEKTASGGYRIQAQGTTIEGDTTLEVDEAIAATGFTTPMQDLQELGVATFYQNRLPAQTPYWESTTVPGIHFAGSITQGSIGLKKYGIPSNSAAVHGFRYNAKVLADHLAEKLGHPVERARVNDPERFISEAISSDGALWNQQSYLARVLDMTAEGPKDMGDQPLAAFVDSPGKPGLAIAIETDDTGDVHPTIYLRTPTDVTEHLLESNPLHDYSGESYRKQIAEVVGKLG